MGGQWITWGESDYNRWAAAHSSGLAVGHSQDGDMLVVFKIGDFGLLRNTDFTHDREWVWEDAGIIALMTESHAMLDPFREPRRQANIA